MEHIWGGGRGGINNSSVLLSFKEYIFRKKHASAERSTLIKCIILPVLKLFWSKTFLTAMLISWLETCFENSSGPNSLYPLPINTKRNLK